MRRWIVIGSIAFVGLLVLGRLTRAQGLPSLEPAPGIEEVDDATLRQVVTGRVCLPDGSPAAGAVVVTSAGGQAITSADGSFTLEVELPLDFESLEVTAVADDRTGFRSLVANTRLVPAALTSTTSVGSLALTLAPNCVPRWLPTFGAQPGTNDSVLALTVYDDGSGPALYAGGNFTTAGAVSASKIAKWDGSSWSALGSGMNDSVHALTVYDDGSGPTLYAGGIFTTAGGASASRIAKWDGSSWSALGSGTGGPNPNYVAALAVFDDGSGPALYAGGTFTTAGGVAVSYIARWDGSSWSALGRGFVSDYPFPVVHALTVHDDGGGPELYAGGNITRALGGGATVNGIGRWDGSSWSALGSGVGGLIPVVQALASYDDGSGPALVAGGWFTTAGGVAASRIARWDGDSWSALGSGMGKEVNALTVFDDGGGPELYAGGEFNLASGLLAKKIARWDGSTWSALGSGMDGGVYALTVYDDGNRPALHAGGVFIGSPANDSYLAKWGCRPKPTVRPRKL